MRTYLFSGVILFLGATLLFFSSCEKENNIALPVVKITELGSGHDSANDKTAFAGRGAHLEVEIIADGLIKEIVVDVHQEEGDFKIIKTYGDSKYVGAKNAIFHEHLSIPAEAPEGDYHLHLIVIDQQGQTATAESEFTIKVASE